MMKTLRGFLGNLRKKAGFGFLRWLEILEPTSHEPLRSLSSREDWEPNPATKL